MKFQVMIHILFRLLKTRKISAADLAHENNVSERSIYRYIEELICSGVPIDIIRGRNGGICLPDTYRLPENFFTKEEWQATVNALGALYEQLPSETVKSAMDKINNQQKADKRNLSITGNILVDCGTWGDTYSFSDKLQVIEDAIDRRACLNLQYTDREGETTVRTVEPHLLIYKQNIWYLYAWCRLRESFRLFHIGRIRSARDTNETFTYREIDKSKLPLQFNFENIPTVQIRLSVSKKALIDVEEWLGIDNITEENGEYFASAVLPNNDILLSKLLGFGDSVHVLSPPDLTESLKNCAQQLLKSYS